MSPRHERAGLFGCRQWSRDSCESSSDPPEARRFALVSTRSSLSMLKVSRSIGTSQSLATLLFERRGARTMLLSEKRRGRVPGHTKDASPPLSTLFLDESGAMIVLSFEAGRASIIGGERKKAKHSARRRRILSQ